MTQDAFAGTVTGGKFIMDFPGHWRLWCRLREGKRIVIVADLEREVRSQRANRYYFGSVIREFRDLWSKGRAALNLPPYTKENTHSVLVQVLVGSEPGPLPGSVLAVPTRTMDSKAFSKLVDDARELALHEYGLLIPEPEERD